MEVMDAPLISTLELLCTRPLMSMKAELISSAPLAVLLAHSAVGDDTIEALTMAHAVTVVPLWLPPTRAPANVGGSM